MRVVGGGERRKKRNGAESSKDNVTMEGQKDVSGGEVEDEGPADWMAKAKNRRDQAHKSKSWRQRGDGEIRAATATATATVKRRKSWNRGRLLTERQAGRQQQHTPEQDRQGRSSSGDANKQPTSTHTSENDPPTLHRRARATSPCPSGN